MSTPSNPPPTGSEPPLSEQIADIVLKVIKPGGIAAGGVGALWLLFVQSDVPKAIASAVIGVGLSYGAKLLMPVHTGTQRRLVQTGEALDRAIDGLSAQAIAAATGFEHKYLLCQAIEYQALRSEGMVQHQGSFIPLLEEVFVPLDLDLSAGQAGFKAGDLTLEKGSATYQEKTIWDFLAGAKREPTFRQMAILAWGGYGKTTLLKHIAFLYGTQQPPKAAPKLIPVLLILRKYRDLLSQENPPDLPDLITQYHIPRLPEAEGLQPSAYWARDLLLKGNALILLDGFDEVGVDQRPRVAQWMARQMQRYQKSVFILTSRPKAYREQDPASQLALTTSLWVRDFGEDQRKKFVTRWYECQERYANGGRETPDVRKVAAEAAQNLLTQIEAQQALKDLAKNPLLLNMIVTLHRRFPGVELPKRRAELYREICQLLLRDRPSARSLDTVLTQCDSAQEILERVALMMMQNHEERIEHSVLLKNLAQILQDQEENLNAKDFLDQVVQISELLVQQEDEYEFAHLSFQEYLAAACLVRTQQEQILYDHFTEDWWKQTILLYAAQTKNPTRLIREALRRGATDLAYACLQETSRRVDPALQAELQAVTQTVVDARYQALAGYLKAGDWEKADNETYRLMITTVGKEEGQYLDAEDLLNFPCEPLQTIDRLWVEHSAGKFGFSVQKEIYLSCGGIADGKYYGEAYFKFLQAVGWIEDRTGRRGYFPKGVLEDYGDNEIGVMGGEVFFFRTKACNM
jgi:GUN4-like/NACHT domain